MFDCIHTVSETPSIVFIGPYNAIWYASFIVKFTASVICRVQRSPWKPGRAPRVYTVRVRRVLRVHVSAMRYAPCVRHARGAAQRGSFMSAVAH